MSDEEILKYAKIFSNAKGDTYKINFVNEDKTIDEVEVWKGALNLLSKKDKIIGKIKNKLEEHIKFCEQEAKGHLENNVCHISLKFEKELLDLIGKVEEENEYIRTTKKRK